MSGPTILTPGLPPEDEFYVKTNTNSKYQYFPLSPGLIHFKVKAAHDACVALTTDIQEAGPIYEVILGRKNNTRSGIRINRRDKVEADTENILSDADYKGFWIMYENKTISVGQPGTTLPFMTFNDVEPFSFCFIGVCTRNCEGSWKVSYVKTNGTSPYLFFPVSNGGLTIKVKAARDAHIAFTTEPEESESMVEILFGCLDNTESMIRKNKVTLENSAVKTHTVVTETEFRDFHIVWDTRGFSVGYKDEREPLIPFCFVPEPSPIFYFGVRTDGVVGTWILTAYPAYHKGITVPRPSLWIDASNGHIPFGAVRGGADVTGEPTFVARIKDGPATIAGRLIPSKEAVYVVKDGKEHSSEKYQVLVRRAYDSWILTREGITPPYALIAGSTPEGERLYVGRVRHKGHSFIGWVMQSTGRCHFSYNGEELTSKKYQILLN